MILRWRGCCVFLGLVLLGALGCGGHGRPVPVSGVVTWEDGTPIPEVSVTFLPRSDQPRGASGFTDNEGKFELTTYGPGDGAIPGDYVITVTKNYSIDAGTPSGDQVDPKDNIAKMKQYSDKTKQSRGASVVIPADYADAAKTRLKATIIPDMPPIKLKLNKKA